MRSAPPFRSVCQLTGDVADRPTKYFALLDALAAADGQRSAAGGDDLDRLRQENDALRRSCSEWAELARLLVNRIDELTGVSL
ncbi:hypothetical protein [Mycolicibacterium porcinum]|uniref:Uncharacterized protein n=1 Tax=Mycolicibacterium porcinum TaxID=39693 RepID=A0ABV3VI43_9MYCO